MAASVELVDSMIEVKVRMKLFSCCVGILVFMLTAAPGIAGPVLVSGPGQVLHKTQLAKPIPAHPSASSATGSALSGGYSAGQATLIFTATDLRKDFHGGNLGTGSLRLYAPGGQCQYPPKSLAETRDVTVDYPSVLITLPANKPVVLASFWTAGAAHCVVGNYKFTPRENVVYRLINSQNRRKGVCSLQLQRLVDTGGQYVNDYSLRPTRGNCDRRLVFEH